MVAAVIAAGLALAAAASPVDRFSAFDGHSVSSGALTRSSQRAYDGSTSLRASFDGSDDLAFQRVWYDVKVRPGGDFWYGLALFIPDLADRDYWRPIRWDNYEDFGDAGDVGGLLLEDGALYVDKGRYGETTRKLVGPVAVPERRWFWVEVHQMLSGSDGDALTELFLDGRLVGSSRRANSNGRTVRTIRYGVVSLADEGSVPGSVWFDRVSLSRSARGPLP